MSTLQAVVAIVVALLAGGGIAGFLTSRANARQVEIRTTDDRYGTLLDRVQKQLDLCLAREGSHEAQMTAMTAKLGQNTVDISEARAEAASARSDTRNARAEVVRLEDRLAAVEQRTTDNADATVELAKQFGAK